MATKDAKPPIPKPKPSADPKTYNPAAAYASQKLASQSIPTSGSPTASCGTGGGGTPGAGGPNGVTPSQYPNVTVPNTTGMPNSNIMNIVNSSVPDGCHLQVSPTGGRSGRNEGTMNHPTGNAVDGYLNCQGGTSLAQKQQYISNAVKNGATGVGTYDAGFIHIDNYHRNLAVWGDNGHSNTADGWAQQAAGVGGGGGQNGAQGGGGGGGLCGDNSGGCAPVSAAAPQAAASMAQNKGLSGAASMTNALAAVAQNPAAAASGLAQQAAAAATGGMNFMGAGGMPDPKSFISSTAAGLVKNMGSGIMPSIVGNIPSMLTGSTSMAGLAQGLLTSKIQEVAGNVLNSAAPQLGQFVNMFSSAMGAAGAGSAAQSSIRTSLNMAFGNAGSLFTDDIENNNLKNLPEGDNPTDNKFLDINYEPFNGQFREAIEATANLVGPPTDVLRELVNGKEINAFSSVYSDYPSLAMVGFGTFTNALNQLGLDLQGLGKLADMRDLFRIGTPGQIAQQIIVNGVGIASGLVNGLTENGIKMVDLADPENDQIVFDILSTITDDSAINAVVEALELDPDLSITSLGDLCIPMIILPRSYEYNYFENLNEITPLLSMSGVGNIRTLKELGDLFESMEELYDADVLYGEPAIYNMANIMDFAEEFAPISKFSQSGELTVADFIGTAAGYVHSDTLPKIAEILDDFTNNTSYLNDYMDLLDTLTQTLNGAYTTPTEIDVPGFGTYTTLDDAVTDIVGAIEDELTNIDLSLDDEYRRKLWLLDSYHTESAMFMLHEQRLRKNYGINVGPAKQTDVFVADGVGTEYPLSNDIDDPSEVTIYVSGVWQSPANYTVDTTTNKLKLQKVLTAGTQIAAVYKTGNYIPSTNKSQIWNFASNLEAYATKTGFGGPAEFLNRIVTDDEHGQRIKAIMVGARNKDLARKFGISLQDFDMSNSSMDTYINYIAHTGIWAFEEGRASELWLQHNQNVFDRNQFTAKIVKEHKSQIKPDIDLLMQNVTRRMLFLNSDNQIVFTQEFAMLYDIYGNSDALYAPNIPDMELIYSDELPSDGYILGNYQEIISEMLRVEGITNNNFNAVLSKSSELYLKEVGISIDRLVAVMQRLFSVTVAFNYGLEEGDIRATFGVLSASKYLLMNIAANY